MSPVKKEGSFYDLLMDFMLRAHVDLTSYFKDSFFSEVHNFAFYDRFEGHVRVREYFELLL